MHSRLRVVNSTHIHEFQEMMRNIYFSRDSERGTRGTYGWLVDEVRELGEALEASDKKALEDEFADVVAWLASLANIVKVDLEKPLLTSTAINAQNVCVHLANASLA